MVFNQSHFPGTNNNLFNLSILCTIFDMKAVLALEDGTIVKGIGFSALAAADAISLSNITCIINTGTVAINLTNPDDITVATAKPLIDIVIRAGEKTGTTAI